MNNQLVQCVQGCVPAMGTISLVFTDPSLCECVCVGGGGERV